MSATRRGGTLFVEMYARAVDEAEARLRELRRAAWEDFALAASVSALALAATQVWPPFALPLFVGGVVGWALGVRALWRRWDLVDRLAGERDAYAIPEVLDYALREATMERRRSLAAYLRRALEESRVTGEERVLAACDELEGLACELEDEGLVLDPACAVACLRLLSDVAASPLLNQELPAELLRSRASQIRAGFAPRRLAA